MSVPACVDTATGPDAPRRRGRPARGTTAPGPDTATALLAAALAEFRSVGYEGTDTGRIARRAGFSPQTFSHWHADKLAVFIQAHALWVPRTERWMMALLEAPEAAHHPTEPPTRRLAEQLVELLRDEQVFVRSLRLLALRDERVRQAVATARQAALTRWRAARPDGLPSAELAALLVQIDTLATALALGEVDDLGHGSSPALLALAQLMARWQVG